MKPNVEVFVIDNAQALADLKGYIEALPRGIFTLDTETDSVLEKKARLYGIGLTFQDNEAFYLPIRFQDGSGVWSVSELQGIATWIVSLCQEWKLVGHNLIYDVLVLENNMGIDLAPLIYSDTILQKHLVDEERPFGLKETAVKYLGEWADKAQKDLYENIKLNGGTVTKDNLQMFKADTNVLAEYCGWDCVLSYKLHVLFEAKLQEEGLSELFYRDEVMPLYKECTIPMKRHGFPVDVPFFEQQKREITADIEALEKEIYSDIKGEVEEFETRLLDKDYPAKRTGSFPKILAASLRIDLPMKDGKVTLSKGAISKMVVPEEHQWFYNWLAGGELSSELEKKARTEWFFQDNPERRAIFNLKSNDHLAWLLFEKLGENPTARTETGKPQVDDEVLEGLSKDHAWIKKLIDYKKLQKLLSTYIDGILERQIDGVIYTSLLQFGTTSGRFSSRDPNLQNIPRIKDEEASLTPLVLKYVNAIKRGLVARAGGKIVNADYSSLEPVAFAHASGDELLRDVFRNGWDLYSSIAINMFNVQDCSADKSAKNYLKKKHPELRQKAKVVALAVVYGAEAGRISQAMSIDYKEAEEIIEAYLTAYPGLRKYMQSCDQMVKKQGYVTTQFGRKRHLPEAVGLNQRFGDKLLDKRWAKKNGVDDIRWKYKNMLNLGKNHPIQGLGAHIVNRAMIATARRFKEQGIEGYVALQVHDEITCIVWREDQAELAKDILRECMEKTTIISVPLQAEPLIASNLAEAK